MKIGFFCSTRIRCLEFAAFFQYGVQKSGDECDVRPVLKAHGDPYEIDGEIIPDVDVAVIYAVLHEKAFDIMHAANIPIIYIDKSYNRDWNYRRVSIGNHQPTQYLGHWHKSDDRRKMFGWEPKNWQKNLQGHVLLAWSDDRDHEWRKWLSPEDHVLPVIEGLRYFTNRHIVYRCKPNRPAKKLLTGVYMSTSARSLEDDLANCHVLITPGTSTCLQALLQGIPTIVLADAIVRNISSTCICQVENPYKATYQERIQLLNDLAYCQWSLEEFSNGEVWQQIRPLIMEIRK